MVLNHMSEDSARTKNYRRIRQLDGLRLNELEVLEKLMKRQANGVFWELGERALNVSDVKFVEDELDFMAHCSSNSEIERILCLYLRQWMRDQTENGVYKLIPQFPLLVDNNLRLIDFMLIHTTVLGSLPIAIECDGKHHENPKVKLEDRRKDRTLRDEYKINTLRFAGRHIYQRPAECIFRIESNIRHARKRDYKQYNFITGENVHGDKCGN